MLSRGNLCLLNNQGILSGRLFHPILIRRCRLSREQHIDSRCRAPLVVRLKRGSETPRILRASKLPQQRRGQGRLSTMLSGGHDRKVRLQLLRSVS